ISQKVIIDMSADRGAYLCQSQSLNIHITNPNFGKLTSIHFNAWTKALKTGMDYLRSTAAADAIKFTLDKSAIKEPDMAGNAEAIIAATAATTAVAGQTERQQELVYQQIPDYDQKRSDMACSLDNPDECEACGS